jgi:hypothetical protein
MTRSLARTTLATAVGLAFASLAAAQSAVPATPPAGQTGILIGRQAAPPAAVAKDAYKAPQATAPAGAIPRTATGAQGIMQPPARAMSGQDPSTGGTGGQKRAIGAAQLMGQSGQGGSGGQDPSTGGTGGQKRTIGAAQLMGQSGQGGAGGQDPSTGGTGGQKRTLPGAQLSGQAGSGMQNPLGVQVRQGPGTGPAGQPPMTRNLPGQGLAGQPNPASNAAKALR